MKEFGYELLPVNGFALLTVPDIDGHGRMYLADFRDSQVLIFKPSGNFLGFSKEKGIRLCRGPMSMVNGIWVVQEDKSAVESYKDIRLTPELLDFVSI